MFCASCAEPVHTDGEPCAACGGAVLLDRRYRFEAVVGRGSAGTTWRATAIADGQVYAIKELPLRHLDGVKARELVAREARVLRELDFHAIPRCHEELVLGSGRLRTLYIVQEYIDGVSLQDEMRAHRYTVDEVLAIAEEVLLILGYLHRLSPPVVHRDVKPGNLMRRADGRLALVDFGAVRDVLKGDLGGSTVAGTFGYMAPEQFQGDASPATDIYGLGATMVALLTRREPQTLVDFAGRLNWAPYAGVPPAVTALLDEMLQADPSRRIPTADAAFRRIASVHAALRGEEEPVAPPPVPVPPPPANPANNETVNVALSKVRERRSQQVATPRADTVWLRPQTAEVAHGDRLSDLLEEAIGSFGLATRQSATVVADFGRLALRPLVFRGGLALGLSVLVCVMLLSLPSSGEAPPIAAPTMPTLSVGDRFVTLPEVRSCLDTWATNHRGHPGFQVDVSLVPTADGGVYPHFAIPEVPDDNWLWSCLDAAVGKNEATFADLPEPVTFPVDVRGF